MAKYKFNIDLDWRQAPATKFMKGQVVEGIDKGAISTFDDKPAITITVLGKELNIPKRYLELVPDSTNVSDATKVNKFDAQKKVIKSVSRLAGLGAGLYLANKHGRGAWGYIGYALAGIIIGGFAGGQVANIVLKKGL